MSAYKFWYCLIWPFFRLLYPCRYLGTENICEGSAMVCCNHSSLLDPIYVGNAFGRNRQLFFMAKAELFKIPVVGKVFHSVGVFPVERGEADIQSVRTCMTHLKNGERVMIFPEGTRVNTDENISAKTGAVRISSSLGVPIIPIYLTKNKKMFRRAILVIGKPFYLEKPKTKDYTPLSDELMRRIYELEPKT